MKSFVGWIFALSFSSWCLHIIWQNIRSFIQNHPSTEALNVCFNNPLFGSSSFSVIRCGWGFMVGNGKLMELWNGSTWHSSSMTLYSKLWMEPRGLGHSIVLCTTDTHTATQCTHTSPDRNKWVHKECMSTIQPAVKGCRGMPQGLVLDTSSTNRKQPSTREGASRDEL